MYLVLVEFVTRSGTWSALMRMRKLMEVTGKSPVIGIVSIVSE